MANGSQVHSFNEHAFSDGHDLNESYKQPSASPHKEGPRLTAPKAGNLSYMHPHGNDSGLLKPWQSVDKTLSEAERHPSQLSLGKTVFPTSTEKVKGAPSPKVPPLQASKALRPLKMPTAAIK